MPNVKDAIAITQRVAPTLSPGGIALLVAIAGLESGIGQAYLPYYNWGSEHATDSWTGATFEHSDSGYSNGTVVQYVTKFRDYGSDDAAAAGLAYVLQHQYPGAVSAATRGDWHEAARLLYGYYIGTKPKPQAVEDEFHAMSKWLRLQGIDPAAITGAAVIAEAAFWAGLSVLALRKLRGRK